MIHDKLAKTDFNMQGRDRQGMQVRDGQDCTHLDTHKALFVRTLYDTPVMHTMSSMYDMYAFCGKHRQEQVFSAVLTR